MTSIFSKKGFTLIELLVVIAILAVLAVAAVVILNPAELLKQSRDSTRLSDLASLASALSIMQAEAFSSSFGTSSIIYVSIPDTTTTCANLGLPGLATGWSYNCVTTSTLTNVDGTGWVPVNFNQLSTGSPLARLPIDPTNTTSSGRYYTYIKGSYKLSAAMESQKQLSKASSDGGINNTRFELSSESSCGNLLTDRDGYSYPTILIGSQCWMAQGLRTKTKADGTCINGGSAPCADATTTDSGLNRACWGVTNIEPNCVIYGAAYKWSAAMVSSTTPGAQGMCPDGWHIPTNDEFTMLERTACTTDPTLCALRLPYGTSTSGWMGTSTDTGSRLIGGGATGFNSLFYQSGSATTYWLSEVSANFANGYYRTVHNSNGIFRSTASIASTYAIRCLKN